MRNHHEKVKDMLESVLPSARRKSARRDRAAVHRRERRAARTQSRIVVGMVDPDEVIFADERRRRVQIGAMVWDRRNADKVAPLTRWAARRVDADITLHEAPVATQVDAFRALLPDSTIGRHALDHVEWALRFRRTAPPPSARGADDAFSEAVVAILESGAHGELNRRIKQAWAAHHTGSLRPYPQEMLLAGHHDVIRFVQRAKFREVVVALADELNAR